ncbi:hypothetical protein [Nocardioides zhouii]|uniref:2'-5' RNA ligase family protein n=1 Tax=Nocardioides zhouii TaxID=1168729 RepID=A0A4Q2T7M2_9ACTN|nr:hypothetical protein [Nocardioides zhouii]RYC12938.1 hypothetical protein EUA94_06830 [Nocardioides zhouii]
MSRAVSSNPVFDRLFSQAVPALVDGSHRQDEPPVDGGRWPVSVVCVPDAPTRTVLADVMAEALVHAGPGHFETGRPDASHITVRALEPYRDAASPADQLSADWAVALDEVGRESPPIRLRLTGVTLTASAVMVQAEPVDDEPWELMRRLRAALGPLAWYEEQWQERDIWYASVLHFAAPVLDAPGLVEWAASHRESLAHDVVLDMLTLTRFRYREDGVRRHMAMEPWRTVALAGS